MLKLSYLIRHWPTGLLLAVAGLLVTGAARSSQAQVESPRVGAQATISISNPTAFNNVMVPEGDDFATQVLGNAWDMNERRDIGWEENYLNVSASNGIWSGTFTPLPSGAGYFFPLFEGFPGILNWGKDGENDAYAINTAQYTNLSLMIYSPARTNTSVYQVAWTTAKPVDWPNNSPTTNFAALDGCYGYTTFFPWPSGWRVYNFDLTQVNGDPGNNSGDWNATSFIRGLRFTPDQNATSGTFKVDWMRLVDPTKGTKITMNWTSSGVNSTVNDKVDIYVATSQSDADAGIGSPLYRGIPVANGSYQINTSVFAPGQYWFFLVLGQETNVTGLSNGQPKNCTAHYKQAVSAPVGPVTVQVAPEVVINSPSPMSGSDYARDVVGNPWDMCDDADVQRQFPNINGDPGDGLRNVSYDLSGTCIFNAQVEPPRPGGFTSDDQVWMNVDQSKPIDTTKYRYMSIRLMIDPPTNPDLNYISWLVGNTGPGWVTRIIWWNNNIATDGTVAEAGVEYEGWHTGWVDLNRAHPESDTSVDNIVDRTDLYPANLGWSEISTAPHLRWRIIETTAGGVNSGADVFHIDWVKLTAMDTAQAGQVFAVHYGITATNGNTPIVYYTTSLSAPTQHTANAASSVAPVPLANVVYVPSLLRSFNPVDVAAPDSVFLWDMTGVTAGTYYVCLLVTDAAGNSTTRCSDTPVQVQ
jgi:hypothetical protein